MAILTSFNNTVAQKPSIIDAIIKQGVANAPLVEMLGSKTISSYLHSWITDRYRDPRANAKLEISDIDVDSIPPSTKQKTSNVCQIIINEVAVSLRETYVSQYGENELPYQRQKVGKEHIKDIEFNLLGLGNNSIFDGPTNMTASTPAKMAGIFYFIPTEHRIDFASNGNPTDFTYEKLAQLIQPIWERGGLDNGAFKIIVGTGLKAKINSWLRDHPAMRVDVPSNEYDPRVVRIATDFGDLDVIMHRLFNNNALKNICLVGDFSQAKLAFLTPTKLIQLPTSSTAVFERYYTDVTLEVTNNDYFACGLNLK